MLDVGWYKKDTYTHIYILNIHTYTASLALVGIRGEVKSGGVSLSLLSLFLHTSAMLYVCVCVTVSEETRETDALYFVCVRQCMRGGGN